MKKFTITLAVLAIVVGSALSIVINRVSAQQPFQGFAASSVEYFDCNPEVSTCSPNAYDTLIMLPSGEKSLEIRSADPHAAYSPHIISINTKDKRISVFPDLGMYYDMPNHRVDKFGVTGDQCSARASLQAPVSFIGQEQAAGFQAFRYNKPNADGTTKTFWLFPAAGCAELQYTTDFGPTKTYTKLVSLTPSFNDVSVLLPKGQSKAPIEISHALYINRYTTGASPMSASEAEANWQSGLKDPNNQLVQSALTKESNWEKAHPAGGGH